MSEFSRSWKRIRDWWEENAPSRQTFAPGATDSQLKKLESVLGVKLPKDFKASYREVNGNGGSGILPSGMYLLSVDEVAQQWHSWCEVVGDQDEDEETPEAGPFKDMTWNKKWIPFSHSGSGDHDCIDMDPGRGGKVGQVIDFSHEQGPLGVTAWSLGEWLSAFADDLERGVYEYDAQEEGLTRVDSNARPKYLAEKAAETVAFLNLPKIDPPSQHAGAIAFLKQFRRAIRDWKIEHTRMTKEWASAGKPYEEARSAGLAALKKVFDKYCQCTKELTVASLSYSYASDPERECPIVGVTVKGKKVTIVIQDEFSPGNFQQYEYTLIKVDDGYKVSDKTKIYDPVKKKFVSYFLLGLPS
jgi:cell wall assembly regulator SMI1